MTGSPLQLENVDLAEIAGVIRARCGASVEGEVVGRTKMRDEICRHLGCSLLEAEQMVDTLIGRGFVRRCARPDARVEWVVTTSSE